MMNYNMGDMKVLPTIIYSYELQSGSKLPHFLQLAGFHLGLVAIQNSLLMSRHDA